MQMESQVFLSDMMMVIKKMVHYVRTFEDWIHLLVVVVEVEEEVLLLHHHQL